MSPQKQKMFLLTLILATTGVTMFFLYTSRVWCEGLACLDFPGIEQYKIKEQYQKESDSFNAMYSGKNNNIRLTVNKETSKENARKNIDTNILGMKRLFEKERSPYPGEISDSIECAEEFIPVWREKEVEGVHFNYTLARLNDRFVYGGCTEEQSKYQSAYILFYCEDQKNLYRLEIIGENVIFESEKENYLAIMDQLKCR